jgi:hypothetical protein
MMGFTRPSVLAGVAAAGIAYRVLAQILPRGPDALFAR